ncbi:MAG: error-prone DNA polymerase [Polyangiaceae bacterium]|nr:error-prone DNA polymerase [Polyangiaceae bacterium]
MSVSPRFAELCAKSNFSFLEGAAHPEELVAYAREIGLSAVGIVDRDGIYGLVRAYREVKERGGKLVSGAQLTIEYDGLPPPGAPHSLFLFVRNHDGYRSLCKLLTVAHHGYEKGTARLRLSSLEATSLGLELAIATDEPLLSRWSPPDTWGPAWQSVLSLFEGRTHVAAHRWLDGLDARRTELAERLALSLGVKVFATARPLYAHPSKKPLADVVHCIRHKTTLDRAGRALLSNAEARLRTPAQMLALFRDKPHWVERSAEIAEGLTFSFSELQYRFPCETLCEKGESADQALRRRTYEGLRSRYGETLPPSVVAQCEKELALIEQIKVAPYFLSVCEVVDMARRRRILCQGRGSAANSAVCYALGVTAVDPARSNLLFERFLSAERAEPPDIDVDFEHERREEVIQELYQTYGRDRAAMVSEVICYRGRSALREVGKVFGLSTEQLDRLTTLVLQYDLRDVNQKTVTELGLDPKDERLFKAISMARQLEGTPRHLGIHVGGFVLSAEPLDNVAPVEPATMADRTVIPWDKDDLDTLQFFKMDVLGLGMLTCVRKTLSLLHEHGFAPIASERFDPIDALARIPAEDSFVYDGICRADTVGVFQIESRAQMSMLPRLKPQCFYDLVIEVAIVRPGPIQGGMVHPYLRRRQKKEPAVAPHPILHSILERTLGVPLFQEQVMQIAMVGAGYGPGEADQLRRDMASWRKTGRLERHRDQLLTGFAARGIPKEFGEALFKQIEGFAEYGFPESHAASFALIVYASCWLKLHHPGIFACGLLNSQPMGFYSPSSIVQDAQRHGVVVHPPCIVASGWDNSLEPEGSSADGLALRLGFRQISGIGEDAALRIEKARETEPFQSVGDLARRADLKTNELEALAQAGALETLEPGRRNAMWRAHAPRLDGLFSKEDLERSARPPQLPALGRMEQMLLDYGRLGLSVGDHPMQHVRSHLDRLAASSRDRILRAADLVDRKDRTMVRVAGLVVGRQRPQTASGVTFISIEDETGVVNLVVTVPVFEKYRHALLYSKMILVTGQVEKEETVVHVLVRGVERLELKQRRGLEERVMELSARSRDFH